MEILIWGLLIGFVIYFAVKNAIIHAVLKLKRDNII